MPRRFALFFLLIFPTFAQAQVNDVLMKKLPEWVALLNDQKDVKHRKAAVVALEVFGAKTTGVVEPLLLSLEKDSDPEVRRLIALCLGRMGPDATGAAEALGKALKLDKSEIVREAAARALGGRLADKAETQLIHLVAALKDTHAGTRAAAAETLKNMGETAKSALPQLIEVIEDRKADRIPRRYAIQIVSKHYEDSAATTKLFLAVYDDKEADLAVRVAAVEGLGGLGERAEGAAIPLSLGLKDKDVELRKAIATALGKLGDIKECWPAIKDALQDKDVGVRYQAIRLSGSLGRELKEPVTALIGVAEKDVNQENRLAAIQELGELGSQATDAVANLTRIATTDTRAAIREAAAAAVKKIKG
ncbi:MAG: HEAT repeat domain-containing protein [Planctomycetes bacterium]|nr:HEAT repeat domain-containing protein [Planctomycetota bacterium]